MSASSSPETLPAELQSMLNTLLYKPDRGTIEWKALEEASAQLKLTPTRVIERSGGLPSTHDYHLNRFLFEHFPRGAAFGAVEGVAVPADLPLADAAAFSIDDASTTEIDDAFSVTSLANGNTRDRHSHRGAFAWHRGRLSARRGCPCAPVDHLFPRRQDHHASGCRDRGLHARVGPVLPRALALRRSERGESDREHGTRSSSG